jgi:hypothetical protein
MQVFDPRLRGVAVLVGLGAALACSPDDGSASHAARRSSTPVAAPANASTPVAAPANTFSPASASEPSLCERPASDAVHDVFCSDAPPRISGLLDLENALGFQFPTPDAGAGYSNGAGYGTLSGGLSGVVFLAHSTALAGELVSPINPRAILIGATTFLAFNRGLQQVELAARDHRTYEPNLYLVTFEQACNASPGGCKPGDLYTPAVESNWTRVKLEDAEDLKDTPFDCRQCHQRAEKAPLLLMREVDGPWTHFFAPLRSDDGEFPEATGGDLLADYLDAKGDEPYAGVPPSVIGETIGFSLQQVIGLPQPIIFDGSQIENERWPYDESSAVHYQATPRRSAIWDGRFAAFRRGEQLAMPFYAPRASDPEKQSRLADAYRKYRAGSLPAESLPDLADVFPDDAQTRAEIGLQTEPGASPATALVEACGPCHNDVLDQTISRARFNIALSRLPRAEIDEAIARLRLPRGAPGSMPPPGRRQVDPPSLPALIDYLDANERSPDDDALLTRAAQLGFVSHLTLNLF